MAPQPCAAARRSMRWLSGMITAISRKAQLAAPCSNSESGTATMLMTIRPTFLSCAPRKHAARHRRRRELRVAVDVGPGPQRQQPEQRHVERIDGLRQRQAGAPQQLAAERHQRDAAELRDGQRDQPAVDLAQAVERPVVAEPEQREHAEADDPGFEARHQADQRLQQLVLRLRGVAAASGRSPARSSRRHRCHRSAPGCD